MNIKLLFTLLLIIPSLSAKKFTEDLGDGMKLIIDDATVHVQKNGSTIGVFKTKAEFAQQRPDLAALSKIARPPSNFDHSKSLHGLSPRSYDAAEQMAQRAKMFTNDHIDLMRMEKSAQEAAREINRSMADINRAMDRGSLDYGEGRRKLQQLGEELSAQRSELQLQAQRATQNFAHSSKPPEQSAAPKTEKPAQIPVEEANRIRHEKFQAMQDAERKEANADPSKNQASSQGATGESGAAQSSAQPSNENSIPSSSEFSSSTPPEPSASDRSRLKEFLDNKTLKDSASMASKVALHVATYEVATSLYQHMRGPTAADRAYAQASEGALQETESITSSLEEIVRKGRERQEEQAQRRLEELRAKAEMFAGLDSPMLDNCHEGYSLAAQLQEQGQSEMSGHLEDFYDFVKGLKSGVASHVSDIGSDPIKYIRDMTIGTVESIAKLVRLAASFDNSLDPQSYGVGLGRLFFDSLEHQQAAKEVYKEKMSLLVNAFNEMSSRKKGELVGKICADLLIQRAAFKAAGTCIRIAQNTTRELEAVQRALGIVEDYARTAEAAGEFFKGEEALATAGAGIGEIGSGAPKGLMNTLAEFNEASSSATGSRAALQAGEGLATSYDFAVRPAERMASAHRRVPIQILDQVIQSPLHIIKDPKGSRAFMYYSRMWKNGKLYNVEVLYDKSSNKIWHFLYTDEARGPLPRIK